MSKLTFNRTTKLYNMILSGLIAMALAQKEGKLTKKVASENLFLGKWLKRAKKQRLFSKCLSEDIDNLLRIYALESLLVI